MSTGRESVGEPRGDASAEAGRTEDPREDARERARRRARLDRAFGSLYPGQGYSPGGGFGADHYARERPPHHGG